MTAPTDRLSRLHGGLRLDANKARSTAQAIETTPVPPRLVVPVSQHAGEAARTVVSVGDRVARGQLLAEAGGTVSAGVHAPSSGTVIGIESRPVPSRGDDSAECIIIETDGEDRPAEGSGPLPAEVVDDPLRLAGAIRDAGIVGLGGAAYPTAEKLAGATVAGIEALILNGVECEPYISCDDMLMREAADGIVSGTRLMLRVLGVERAILAIESDKPAARDAMRAAIEAAGDVPMELVQIPTVYPSGGEDQLVKLLSGREVPSGGLPADVGFVVQNVATAHAVHRLASLGEPLTSRVVTVTGDGVGRPGNYRVRFGTPIADVARAAGGCSADTRYLIMGGPMTGIALPHDELPVTKATNCLIFATRLPSGSTEPERPCIRCGDCAEVCPVRLQPQQIHRSAEPPEEASLAMLGLDDCIECGCCDLVCPSHIALTAGFRRAKAALALNRHERRKSERARRRFEEREARLRSREAETTSALEARKREAGADAIRGILERHRRREDGD